MQHPKKNEMNGEKNTFSASLKENEEKIVQYLGESKDVQLTHFQIKLSKNKQVAALLLVIDGLVDEEAKRNNILKPLIEPPFEEMEVVNLKQIQSRIAVKEVRIESNFEEAINYVLKSKALLMVEGFSKGLLIAIEGFEIRTISQPETEQTVRGSREGFIESLDVNLSLIRRRITNPSLRFETLTIGDFNSTNVTVAYIKEIADKTLVKRVIERLKNIKVDSIHNSGDIEQFIEDHPYSIFSTIGNTERPDFVANLLMEGRIIILIDGDPTSLFVPILFVENIKHIEDYHSRPYYSSFIRLIRFFAFFISITLPALYISAINFNKALIPSDMIVPVTIARESVPFPLALEVIIMILIFEVVREAGVRLPKQIGTAISIVGPLILGDVAVTSSLVGAPTVIIVSISYIASFVITPIADVTALIRIAIFIPASIFGSYGLVIAMLALLTHMISLTSLGVPFMAPFSPMYFSDWKDSIIRLPTRLLKYRKQSIPTQRKRKINSLPNIPNMEEKK